MEIYIAGQLAALKQNTSFEYVSENRLFSGSDGYTLTITFPLRGCPQNQAIFGHINRTDISTGKVIFDCEIRDRTFCKFGCVTITEISEAEVKVQFLDGRSEQNFDTTFDTVYINELDLGRPPTTNPNSLLPEDVWYLPYGIPKEVPLPWVNDSTGNIQNCAAYVAPNDNSPVWHYEWHSQTDGLSWQPYLLYIMGKICEAIGYSCDFSVLDELEEYRYLLICNTLPYAWEMPEYAKAMPHWTVAEFFEKLELFLNGEFNIDHRTKHISFAFTKKILRDIPPVHLEDVVEEHSTEVKVENDRCEYLEAKNLVYKECDHQMWKFYSCDWFIKAWQNRVVRYNYMSDLLKANAGLATWDGSSQPGSNRNKLLYAADINAYFVVNAVSRTFLGFYPNSNWRKKWEYKCVLQPINLLGGRIVDERDDADTLEVEFVPARIDDTDATYGKCLFLSFSGYDEPEGETYGNPTADDPRNDNFYNSVPIYSLEAGEKDRTAEYYDCIYIAWWDGAPDATEQGKLIHPYSENIVIRDDWSNWRSAHFSLRLNKLHNKPLYSIEPTKKTTFKFISDTIPNVRALFIVRGKRYICEKLTATFTEHGMSQLIKGVFYPINSP